MSCESQPLPGFHGHRATVAALAHELPPAVLLYGEPSIGKVTLARRLAEHHGVVAVDRFEHTEKPLTVDIARSALWFVSRAGFGRAGKLVLLRMDKATPAAQQALLKTLEEPPPRVRFILTASRPVLGTVESRCQLHRLGLLHPHELRPILIDGHGVAPGAVDRLIANGNGTVRGSLHAPDDKGKATALAVVRALATHDPELYERTFRQFDNPAMGWLTIWLREAMTGRLKHFTEQEMYGLHAQPTVMAELIVALSRYPAAQARLGVRAALQPLLRFQ